MFEIVPEDQVTWEVEYADGTTLLGISPESYSRINRDKLKMFKIIGRGEVLFSTWPPDGATGHNLVFRRRTALISDGMRSVVLIVGWIPHGPAFAINVRDGQFRISEEGFIDSDPVLYPPVPMPGESDQLIDNLR